jgi:hypothetical protein
MNEFIPLMLEIDSVDILVIDRSFGVFAKSTYEENGRTQPDVELKIHVTEKF